MRCASFAAMLSGNDCRSRCTTSWWRGWPVQGPSAVWVAGCGADGRDGPTDAAGAVADGETVERARRRRIDAERFLRRHDSYTFFKRVGGHIRTGLTGTNVNDLYIVFVHPVSIGRSVVHNRALSSRRSWRG